MEGSDGQRELDGVEPDEPGPQHRRSHDRRRHGRSVEKDHRRRAGRDRRAEGHDQHDGRPVGIVRVGSDACGARGRHRGQTGRTGRRRRRQRHVARPDGQRELNGVQSDDAGAWRRRSRDGRCTRQPEPATSGRGQRRDLGAEGHDQHDGRPAFELRRRGDARGPRGRYRGQAGRTSPSAGRIGYVGRPDGQRELDGVEPHQPGARDRRGDDGGGDGRPVEKDHGRGAGRDRRVERDDQHDGRSAVELRRRSDARGPRGRHRGQARWASRRAGRQWHVEGSDGQRELDGVEPHQPGARDRRSHDGGC